MRKFLLGLAIVAVASFAFSSCAATKRDCQGVKHYRLKNGIYI
jgi:predicted small secreted protein